MATCFSVCFVTGVLSHLHKHPLSFVTIPPAPMWGYRVSQGLHVVSGFACVPLILAKLYAVYPRLFQRPLVPRPSLAGVLTIAERGSIAVLVASSLLQLATGGMNVAKWYAFGFGFVEVHWALAWVSIGALLVHIAVKLPVTREALSSPLDVGVSVEGGRDRRWFVRGALGVAAGAVALSVGQTLRPLEPIAVRAKRRPSRSPLGVPVNRTADEAGIATATPEDGWSLRVAGPGGSRTLTYLDLMAMPQVEIVLPISCVEGWSASARWTGVRVRDRADLVGGVGQGIVRVTSSEARGSYRVTTLPTAYASHELTLRIYGVRLPRDHGFPARVIAPNRPGVLQTKWVKQLEVLV